MSAEGVMKRVVVFMGTRPEGIKLAPVIRALEREQDLEPVVVSTGQHREMLAQVVDVFGLKVHYDLKVMRNDQTLASLTARLLSRADRLLDKIKPDLALVQGDTTTVLAMSLACFYRRIPVGHVEAGLRTWNMAAPFPEEANRRLTSPLAALHFAPTEWSRQNLLREGVSDSSIFVTGNPVIDALFMEIASQSHSPTREQVVAALDALVGRGWGDTPYVLITGHRRENFNGGFVRICDALKCLAGRFPDHRFIYPVHLNPNVRGPVYERLSGLPNISLIPPQGYREFVALMKHCRLILTDSGGVQEEAPSLGKPVLVMRETTERPEGVEAGSVLLVGSDVERIVDHASCLLTSQEARRRMLEVRNPYGDGQAAPRIVRAIRDYLRC